MGPPAHLSLDVALALHIAEIEADMSEFLDFVRCKAYRVARSDHADVVRIVLLTGVLAFAAWQGRFESRTNVGGYVL